jgi:hypothetical protein
VLKKELCASSVHPQPKAMLEACSRAGHGDARGKGQEQTIPEEARRTQVQVSSEVDVLEGLEEMVSAHVD